MIFLFPALSSAVELNTVRPLAPYGVFSAWSAQSLEKGAVSFGLTVEGSKEPDFFRYTAGASYGIEEKIELTVNFPYFAGGNDAPDGLEDLGVAAKYRILEQGRYGPSAALLLLGYLPTGDDELTRDWALGAGVLVSKKLGPFMAHLNGLWTTPSKKELDAQWDLIGGLSFPLYHNMEVLAEFHMRDDHFADDIDLSEARVGYRLFNETFFGTIGIGTDLKNRTPEYRVIFSIATVFSKKRGTAF